VEFLCLSTADGHALQRIPKRMTRLMWSNVGERVRTGGTGAKSSSSVKATVPALVLSLCGIIETEDGDPLNSANLC
jgi:hypothetical protein